MKIYITSFIIFFSILITASATADPLQMGDSLYEAKEIKKPFSMRLPKNRPPGVEYFFNGTLKVEFSWAITNGGCVLNITSSNEEFIFSGMAEKILSKQYSPSPKHLKSDKFDYTITAKAIEGITYKYSCLVQIVRTPVNKSEDDKELSTSDIKIKKTDQVIKKQYGNTKIVKIVPGTSPSFEIGKSANRAISFDKNNSLSVSQGVNIALLSGAIEKTLGSSVQTSISEEIFVSSGITIDGSTPDDKQFCEEWELKMFVNRRLAKVISPEYKVFEPINFWFTESAEIDVTPLCKNK